MSKKLVVFVVIGVIVAAVHGFILQDQLNSEKNNLQDLQKEVTLLKARVDTLESPKTFILPFPDDSETKITK